MRLRRISLPGFGRLRDFEAEFAPGVNVVHGMNEAGKSTLQQAISALLYGFYDHDRAREAETRQHERFRPWDAGPYRGSLLYELEDGSEYEVRRDFSTPDVLTQLIDPATGMDLSPQFGRGRRGNIPFARRHLGMPRGVFQSCAFITQGDVLLASGATPREIGDAIAALADPGRRDVSAARALERLDDELRRIGSDRARTARLPVAREEMRRAQEELRALDADRQAMAQKAAHLDAMESRFRDLCAKEMKTQFLLHRAHAVRLRSTLEDVEQTEQKLQRARLHAGELSAYADMPAHIRDSINELKVRREQAQAVVSARRDELEKAAADLTATERLEYETLRDGAGDLSAEQISQLHQAAYEPARPSGLRAALGRIFRAAVAAVVRAARWLLRRPAVPVSEEEPVLSVTPEEARDILQKHRRFLELRPLVDTRRRLQREMEAAQTTLAAAEDRLRALLQEAGGSFGDDLDAALEEFQEAWTKHQACLTARAAAAEAERHRDAVLAGRTEDEVRAALAHHEQRQTEMLAAHPELAGCEADAPPEQLSTALETLRGHRSEAEVAAGRTREEMRLALERHRPRHEIEEDLERASRTVARLERARVALKTARDAIEQAMISVYRDFAPAVNAYLSEGIEMVTEGRYTRAHVDPATLKVSLLLPETGQVITGPPVSHGTWTLTYVLMRIGLAQHMSSVGEPVPLLLDDPFVDVDARRLPLALDYLLELGERMQVLLFTKDESIVHWFETRATQPSHRLHRLSAARLIAPAV